MLTSQLKSEIAKLFPNAKFDASLQSYQNYLKPAGKAWMICDMNDAVLEYTPTLSAIAKLKQEYNFPIKAIGKHSNIMFTERGFDGLILILDALPVKPEDIEVCEDRVIVKKSAPLSYLVMVLAEKGVDYWHLNGIPGTVFGAVLNNSGGNRTGLSIASNNAITKITTYDLEEDCEKIFIPDADFFKIRGSLLKDLNYRQTRYVITQVEMLAPRENPEIINEKIAQISDKRSVVNREGYAYHTAGSFWSNGHALRDRGKRVRELLAEVNVFSTVTNGIGYSPNFGFLYTSATTTDKQLAQYTKTNFVAIKERFNFELHAEVEIIDKAGQISINEFWEQNQIE